MKPLASIKCFVVMAALAGWAPTQSRGDETKAVSARVAAYVDAFNRRDLDACAEHWSENAEYVVPGSAQRMQGRAAIRKALEKLLETDEPFQMSVSEQRFRAATPDTVLEEGTATLVSPSHGVESARYLVVHVRQDGQWYRDSVRETAVASPAAGPTIQELQWLLGDWKHEKNGVSTHIHGEWMNGRRFISRRFKLRSKAGRELEGTQIIGRDPSSGTIRSWGFDSEGGIEQAAWHRDGDRWLVKVKALLPDGSVGSEQRVLSVVGGREMTSEVIEQQVNGQLLPASEQVTLVRDRQE